MLALSLLMGVMVVIPARQTDAASFAPLPGKKPAELAQPANNIIKASLPAKKPETGTEEKAEEQTSTYEKAIDKARMLLGMKPKSIDPAPPAQTKTNETAPTEITATTPADNTEETFTPITAANAPIPAIKPVSDSATLTKADALLYKQIFAYQAVANWAKADKLVAKLGNHHLRGHVLYQRYMHPTAYITSFDELNGWMNAYADHPGADRIYKLALAKMPDDFEGHIRPPENSSYRGGLLSVLHDTSLTYLSPRKRSKEEAGRINHLQRTVRANISKGRPSEALNALKTMPAAKLLDSVEYDELQAAIANSYMLVGKLNAAKKLAMASAARSGAKVPRAGWVGGLIAWRQKEYHQAASLFTQTARSAYSSSWFKGAGAYWASRSYMRAGKIREVSPWLEQAARYPRTFYGMIATKALGWDHDFNWHVPALTDKHIDTLSAEKAGLRAIALVAAGQHHLAEAELKNIDTQAKPALGEALLAYTVHKELPSFALKIAETTRHPQGGLYDAALYPLSPWATDHKHKVDRAIIHALIRQESRFNPYAESHSGATGLMQLMPRTASFVSGNSTYRTKEGLHSLKDPRINLEIGEKYIRNLLDQDAVDNDLFSLAIAYNAGPGNLRKWKRELAHIQDDPLLFIESIPMAETRAFVERVMAFYWIYRIRLDQPTPSLQAVAEGTWPRYVMMDGEQPDAQKQAAQDTTDNEYMKFADSRN